MSDAPLTTPIWDCLVLPQLDTYYYNTIRTFFQPSALSFVATPHQYWRGTIKYRLEINCSKFHRGKIAIMYEPNCDQYALITSTISLNKNYLKIIDIQETQDVEFCVEYCQPYVWLQTLTAGTSDDAHGSAFSAASKVFKSNGFITVFPFTKLQSPDTSSVSVNVYVSGVDMQFNMLSGVNLPLRRDIATQMGSERELTCLSLNQSSDTGRGCSEFCFGEEPFSFRAAVKRYVTTSTNLDLFDATVHHKVTYVRPIILTASPSYTTTTTTPNIIQYLKYAYLGVKGSMRKRIRFYKEGELQEACKSIVVILNVPEIAANTSGPTKSSVLNQLPQRGGIQVLPATNGGVEVELPYYSPNLFEFACGAAADGGYTAGQLYQYWVRNFTIDIETHTVSVYAMAAVESAAGEDFTYMRFQGAPYFSV